MFRSLLSLYSNTIRQLVSSFNREMVGISVPVKANTLAKLGKVLTSGIATSDYKDELLEVIEAANFIGIQLNEYELNETGLLSTTVEETVFQDFDFTREHLKTVLVRMRKLMRKEKLLISVKINFKVKKEEDLKVP